MNNVSSSVFLKFCAVGVIGFLTDIAVLYSAKAWLGWYGARLLSFTCAASLTLLLNRRYTFNSIAVSSTKSGFLTQYMRYLVLMMFGGTINYLTYVAVLEYFPISFAPLMGVGLGSIAGLALNFTLARMVVFRRKPEC